MLPPCEASRWAKLAYGLAPHWHTGDTISQTGLQAALGTCFFPPNEQDKKAKKEFLAALRPSLLMSMWPVLVFGGATLGLVLPLGRWRRWAVSLCAAAAFVVLVAQVILDFPIVTTMESDRAEMERPDGEDNADNRGGQFVTQNGVAHRVEYFVYGAYTPWFDVAALGLVLALVACVLEWWRDRPPGTCEPEPPVRSP